MLGTHQLINQSDDTRDPAGSAAFDAVKTFARIARDLAEQPDTTAASQRIVGIGFAVTGSLSVALVRVTPSVAASVHASTGDGHGETDCGIIGAVRQGAVAQAALDRSTVLSDDLTVEFRWPEYTPKILAVTPIRSVLAIPLQTGPRSQDIEPVDVLVFYADRAHFFSDELRETAGVLADHAAITLAFNSARDHATNLKVALKTSREIGAAMGILMERHKLTENAAFDLLKTRSQDLNIKLHTLATSLNTFGELPTRPGQTGMPPAH